MNRGNQLMQRMYWLKIGLVFGLSITSLLAQKPTSSQIANAGATNSLLAGEQLFQNYCSACHNFSQKGIGPSLEHVLANVPANQLTAFIRNAPEQISNGNPRAKRLYQEYKQMMPAFTMLSETDLAALLSYIKANQKKELSPKERLPEGISDPIPTKITQLPLLIHLEHYATAPASAQRAPLARINKMTALAGEQERLFVVDLRGKLYERMGNAWRVALDMQQERPNFIHTPGLATGFGSFAFHPDFYRNGKLYTTHTEKTGSGVADFSYADSIKVSLQWVLTEWRLTDPKAGIFSGRSRELMRINMVSVIHGVQEIAFNPVAQPGSDDYGLLYVGVGDGGATENGYAFLCGQKHKVWGTVLRIDPAGHNSQNSQYGIPATNPYASDTGQATRKEIYCRGFRNPNRLCWTPAGKLLITDIGQAHLEEINLAISGADYGWPTREGTFVIDPGGRMDQVYALPEQDGTLRYTYPVAQYDHDEGKAISGGFVYSGTAIGQLTGKYLFGDVTNGRLFLVDSQQLTTGTQTVVQELALSIDGQLTTFQAVSGQEKPDLRFGMGARGELFVLTKSDGKIYRVSGLTNRQ